MTGAGGDGVRSLRPSAMTAAWFDREQTFTVVEVSGADLFFQAVSRTGLTVDAGVIRKTNRNTQRSGR